MKRKQLTATILTGAVVSGALYTSVQPPLHAASDAPKEPLVTDTAPHAELAIATVVSTQPTPAQNVAPNSPTAVPAQAPSTTPSLDQATAARVAAIKAEMDAIIAQKSAENKATAAAATGDNRFVPFYSQLLDITPYEWKTVGCGIAGLAMLIDYYEPAVDVNTLLQQALSTNSYDDTNGWSHAGLIDVAKTYGLTGQSVTLSHLSTDSAFSALQAAVASGPVMVSVHYTFDPQNTIPHLAVVSDIRDNVVYYNDPASLVGGEHISASAFKLAWKKRYIEIRPSVSHT